MQTTTKLDQFTCTLNRIIEIRFIKEISEGDTVIFQGYHRTSIIPGVGIDAHLDVVDAHLATLGFPAIGITDRDRLRKVVVVEHTTEAVEAYTISSKETSLTLGVITPEI